MSTISIQRAPSWKRFAAVAGPGLAVMLADTDAGCIITAAQSGAQWGYKLLLLQFILMPVLYVVQELTVRLGIVTGQGHAQLIHRHFGRFWAWISAGTLIISCIGGSHSQIAPRLQQILFQCRLVTANISFCFLLISAPL